MKVPRKQISQLTGRFLKIWKFSTNYFTIQRGNFKICSWKFSLDLIRILKNLDPSKIGPDKNYLELFCWIPVSGHMEDNSKNLYDWHISENEFSEIFCIWTQQKLHLTIPDNISFNFVIWNLWKLFHVLFSCFLKFISFNHMMSCIRAQNSYPPI